MTPPTIAQFTAEIRPITFSITIEAKTGCTTPVRCATMWARNRSPPMWVGRKAPTSQPW